MTNEQADKLRKDILNDNKMLYCMYKRPMNETCMCWGLDIPDSWLDEVDDLSKKLEGMNSMVYPFHRVRIQADQVKNKFGILHYYYSIIVDPPEWMCMYERAVEWLVEKVSKLDFKFVKIIDKEPYDEVIEEKVSVDDVAAAKDTYANVSNVEIIDMPDGTAVKKTTFHHYEQSHRKPTKHRLLYKLVKRRWQIKNFFRRILDWQSSHSQKCISEVVDSYAFRCVRDSEEKCIHKCEKCGRTIGEEWSSATCTTLGWISYLCEECAEKDSRIYVKNGERWCAGKKVEDKDEDKN